MNAKLEVFIRKMAHIAALQEDAVEKGYNTCLAAAEELEQQTLKYYRGLYGGMYKFAEAFLESSAPGNVPLFESDDLVESADDIDAFKEFLGRAEIESFWAPSTCYELTAALFTSGWTVAEKAEGLYGYTRFVKE